jgi:hypothetical protein
LEWILEIILSAICFFSITAFVYFRVGYANIAGSYRLWFQEGYWVNYNVVEAGAWLAKRNLAIARNHTFYLRPSNLGI